MNYTRNTSGHLRKLNEVLTVFTFLLMLSFMVFGYVKFGEIEEVRKRDLRRLQNIERIIAPMHVPVYGEEENGYLVNH